MRITCWFIVKPLLKLIIKLDLHSAVSKVLRAEQIFTLQLTECTDRVISGVEFGESCTKCLFLFIMHKMSVFTLYHPKVRFNEFAFEKYPKYTVQSFLY